MDVWQRDSIWWPKGFKTAERTGLRMPISELHRLKGELLLIRDAANVVEAERCLRNAIQGCPQAERQAF